jgi:hypothetical protein
MFITTFHRWFPTPLRLNLAMVAARCFAGWDASGSALGAGREVLPGPHVWTLSRRFGGENVVFYMWNFVWNPVTWDICLVWTKWAFCLKMFCHAMHVFSSSPRSFDFEMLAGKVYKWGKENQRVSIIFLEILGDFGKFGIDTSIWSRYVFGQSISTHVRTVKLIVETLL